MTIFSSLIAHNWQSRYRVLRLALYLIIIVVTLTFVLRVFFPTLTQAFDFRAPQSSKNTLLSPRSPQDTPRLNGKIESGGTLVADTTVVGDFSLVNVTAVLEKKSAIPETLDFTLRRSYQSFFYPTGESLRDFPPLNTVYKVRDTYYELQAGTLYPFVSEQAYLSRYPKDHAIIKQDDFIESLPLSETWLGFRVGSLLSNADGVFVVVSEEEVRPIGSAEIFLALGYNFSDVTPVSEEELGVYRRGRIFLLGTAHPDGTILFDQDEQIYYLIDQKTKRPLLPGTYRDFLIAGKHPILVSSRAGAQSVICTLTPNILNTTLSCSVPITSLVPGFGNDFELQVSSPQTAIDLSTLSVSFETAKNKQNMMTLLSQIKQRLLTRFGGA